MKKDSIIKNLYKYREYINYYSKIQLRTRVSGSYLGLLWLFIDPLMFMLIYTFIVTVIFKNNMKNFNVYAFIGLTAWNMISRSILNSATAIVRNKVIFEQVYFHKFVYPTIMLVTNLYEFFIAFSLVLVLMLFAGIPFTWHIIEMLPITFVMFLFAYGFALIVAHIGVYFFDLRNILDFTLRFIFYLTPIMWSYESLDAELKAVLRLNPAASIIGAYRNVIMYGKSPSYRNLLVVALFSLILIWIGYKLISKHEDEYARMI